MSAQAVFDGATVGGCADRVPNSTRIARIVRFAGLARFTRGALLVALCAIVAACGGNADPPQPNAPAAPTVATQPANASVQSGQTATFSVTAGGTGPFTYQWRRNGTPIAGANASSYTTPATTSADSGATFDVVITNAGGSVTSSAATLTVTAAAPTVNFTTQPAAQSVVAGATATFTSAATCSSGTPAYQWQKSTDNGATFANVAGATGATFTTPATTTADTGTLYRVQVTCGTTVQTSTSAALTVTAPAPTVTISQQPASTSVTAGATATFSVTAACSTGSPAYQWQKLAQGGTAFADVAGATSATYTTPGTVSGDNASQFRVVVTCGTASSASSAAILTVTAAPASVTLSPLSTNFRVAAKLIGTSGIAREASGSYVFLDNTGLRRISSDLKTVTTVVQAGNAAVDGPAATARIIPSFNTGGVVVDATGNIYVTETNAIRKLDTSGVMTTLAGVSGTSGNVDGTGSAARFQNLNSLAIGADGDLYAGDGGANTIRRITAAGVVTTYAGSGTSGFADGAPAAAQFSSIRGVAVASNNDVYVTDSTRVRRIVRSGTGAGSVQTFAGNASNTFADGVGAAAGIPAPSRIAISGGVLYVLDSGARIRRIDLSTAAVTTFAGGQPPFPQIFPNDGTGTGATFDASQGGFAANPDGSLFVSDRLQFRTVSTGAVVRTVGLLAGAGVNNATPPDGVLTDQADVPLASNLPALVYGDGSGTALFTDNYHWLRRVDATGQVSLFAGLGGSSSSIDGTGSVAQFTKITAITRDSAGSYYVGDAFAVRKVTSAGAVTFLAGSYTNFGAADGNATTARFNNINGIAVDAAGNVYVADANNAIRKVDPSGNVTTLAGVLGAPPGSVDGQGSAARFRGPGAMAMAPDGTTLYLCDSGALRTVTTSGAVATIGGTGCTGLAFDTDGTLYLVNQGGTVNAGNGTLSRRLPGSTTFQTLLNVNAAPTDLTTNPQTLGFVFSIGVIAPKTLAIASSNQMVKAVLP